VGTRGEFVGFRNYINVLTDQSYWDAWIRSIIWIVGCSLLATIFGFALALLLNSATGRLGEFARTWSITSWIIPTICVAIIWLWILNASFGILNHVLMNIGLISSPIVLLGNPDTALYAAIAIHVWRWFPFTAIILLAGLSTIPKELYESASVDGASTIQKFFKITMPGLQNVTFTLGVVGTLWVFNVFDTIWLLTSGGPLNATTTVPIFIYWGAFRQFQLGRTSAASVITSIIMFVVAMLLIKLTQPKD